MAKEFDIFSNIVPSKIKNTNESGSYFFGRKTTDKVFLSTARDLKNMSEDDRIKGITDFAMLNNTRVNRTISADRDERIADYYLRSNTGSAFDTVDGFGAFDTCLGGNSFGLAPCVNIKFDNNFTINDAKERMVVKTKHNKTFYGIELGNYPKTLVNKRLNDELESLYNEGIIKDGLAATGKCYTTNGGNPFSLKYAPEFTYRGEKYVRYVPQYTPNITLPSWKNCYDKCKAYWVKVEPVDFIVKNYKDVQRGRAKQLELETENVVITNINFVVGAYYSNSWEDSIVRAYLNGTKDVNYSINSIQNFKGAGFLNEALSNNFTPITEHIVSHTDTAICPDAFNGCVNLKKILMHRAVVKIGENAFAGCNFNYLYQSSSGFYLVLDENLPKDIESKQKYIDIKKAMKAFKNFDYEFILSMDNYEDINKLIARLSKDKYTLPYKYVEAVNKRGEMELITENSDYRYFKNEVKELDAFLYGASESEIAAVMNFARALGCFSNKRFNDKIGNPTEVLFAQRASSLFAQIIKNRVFTASELADMVSTLGYNVEAKQEFLEFLIKQMKDNQFSLIRRLEHRTCKGIFAKLFTNFDEVKNFKNSIDENGKPVVLSWENALIKFYAFGMYKNVDEDNKDIAEMYGNMGISQEIFDRASRIRRYAKKHDIPHHILGKPLKEETALDKIEDVKAETFDLLKMGEQVLKNKHEEKFTYEMLDKYDPQNAIIGLLCDCCATINSEHYGREIARQTVVADDVQNLVVRDNDGKIIAKGAMYVDEKYGFAVINDFEMNKKYRKNETLGSGFYNDAADSIHTINRQKIFDTFMRGIKAFVAEYDKQHPDKPIKQVNVGVGYNRLKSQCIKLNENGGSYLGVPNEYSFEDAALEQYTLYRREKHSKKKHEKDQLSIDDVCF